jgi:acyl-CoA thioesterase-1
MESDDMDDQAATPFERRFGRRALHCSLLAFALGVLLPSSVSAAAPSPVVAVLGDSLSAEYGIERGAGWVALLEQRLRDEKIGASVVNASISGDTTSGGRSRLPTLLKQQRPTVLVIELGANDALRGLPIAMTEANLVAMTRDAKQAGAKVLLVGMQVPPNYGRSYAEQFRELFARIAKAEGAAVVPFMLTGVADAPNAEALFQADRLHPTAEAQPAILNNLWPALRPLLK